jgi:hypothetical protein
VHPDHRRQVLIGIAGALPAMAVVVLVLLYAPVLFAFVRLPPDTVADRLAFAARWMAIPGLCLLVGVILAARRGFHADAIDGTLTPANFGMEINLRYNTNTLEQTVLAVIAWTSLSTTVSQHALGAIPAAATLFLIGRVTFWVGYLIHPMGRTFGMTLTVLPTVAAYLWLACHVFAGQ